MPFMFEIGGEYETQAGERVKVLGRTDLRGYECLECSDGRYRYDRSNYSDDAGRCTGTAHDYSCPHNLKRADMVRREQPAKDAARYSNASFKNRGEVAVGVDCGCYYCLATFDGGAVQAWTDAGETALCPQCGIDAVLPGITDSDALKTAHARGFVKPAVDKGDCRE